MAVGALQMHIRQKSQGFTLVELIMALAFFSFMMATLSIGVLQVMRIYQAGVSSRRTQQAARVAMEDITREVRAANYIRIPAAASSGTRLCLEGAQNVDYQWDGTQLLKRTGFSDCNNATTTPVALIEASAENNNLEVREFLVEAIQDPTSGQSTSAKVNLVVSTGGDADDDLLEGNTCKPGVSGSQYCSVTELSNIVSIRSN